MAVFGAKSGKFLRVEHDEELPDFKPVLGENLKPSNIDLDYCYGYWVVKFCGKDIDYFVRLQDALEYLDTLADQPISAGY